jgi:hypothetical protein
MDEKQYQTVICHLTQLLTFVTHIAEDVQQLVEANRTTPKVKKDRHNWWHDSESWGKDAEARFKREMRGFDLNVLEYKELAAFKHAFTWIVIRNYYQDLQPDRDVFDNLTMRSWAKILHDKDYPVLFFGPVRQAQVASAFKKIGLVD